MTGTDLLQLCLRLGLTPVPVWHCFGYGKADDIHSSFRSGKAAILGRDMNEGLR